MTAGVAPEPAGPVADSAAGLPSGHFQRLRLLTTAFLSGQPLQADLWGAEGAQLDVFGVWWVPAGRRRVWRSLLSAGVVTPAERCHGSTS